MGVTLICVIVMLGLRPSIVDQRHKLAAKRKKTELHTLTTEKAMQKADWQIVRIWPDFVVEVNCNGGGHHRVYPHAPIALID